MPEEVARLGLEEASRRARPKNRKRDRRAAPRPGHQAASAEMILTGPRGAPAMWGLGFGKPAGPDRVVGQGPLAPRQVKEVNAAGPSPGSRGPWPFRRPPMGVARQSGDDVSRLFSD